MSMDGKGRWVDNVFVERVEERAAGKGEISTEASALILAHSGEPIVRETDVASAGVETA